MKELDKLETNVSRSKARAKLYNDTMVDCIIYAEDSTKKAAVG